jgi:hypothetical protein
VLPTYSPPRRWCHLVFLRGGRWRQPRPPPVLLSALLVGVAPPSPSMLSFTLTEQQASAASVPLMSKVAIVVLPLALSYRLPVAQPLKVSLPGPAP